MSYIANQYNYCTPLSSASGLTDASSIVDDVKYFTLFDNVLDGTYHPVSGDVGLWGNTLSDDNGFLSVPFVISVDLETNISALSVSGSRDCYPVDFIVELYHDEDLVYQYTKTDNNTASTICLFNDTYYMTHYVITITRISQAGVARLYNTYQSWYVRSTDNLSVLNSEAKGVSVVAKSSDILGVSLQPMSAIRSAISVSDVLSIDSTENSAILNTVDKTADSLKVGCVGNSYITNTIDKTSDLLILSAQEDVSHVINTAVAFDKLLCECFGNLRVDSELVNIHTVMKQPTRRIYGKVYITYTDPLLNEFITDVDTSGEAYNSALMQVVDGENKAFGKSFTLYDNNLSGNYYPAASDSQVGWTSDNLSDSDGYFAENPYIVLNFAARPIVQFTVCFDASHDNIVKDFIVDFVASNGDTIQVVITDNDLAEVIIPLDNPVAEVVSIKVTVTRVAKAHYPATILDVPSLSEFLYVGYQDVSNLISINLLEELTYLDEIEALGGVSANEIKVVLDNSDRTFDITNTASPVAKQLRRNRKIKPYLGAEVIPGEIEWHSLGTFWSYSWDVPLNNLTASVTGFDTIGLLGLTSYTNHQMLVDKSIGYMIDYVLTDAKTLFSFLEWEVSDELYDIVIPYAWFNEGSHAAALRRISECYPMHIYCNRQGRIVAAPQKLHLDYYYDVWSDSTNIVDKTYSSLNTVVPNHINITVLRPKVAENTELFYEEGEFNIVDIPERTINFTEPYVSGIVINIDCDASVSYAYDVYSWGMSLKFSGTGRVYSIQCLGNSLDVSNTQVITKRYEDSIRMNGVVTREIKSDFIQTTSLAGYLIQRLGELADNDKYDVDINYRGDIALSINDPILLLDSLSPTNKYNIKRHQLSWDGGLTGTANLNT